MKVIVPIAFTPSMLVTSSAVEADAPAWNSGEACTQGMIRSLASTQLCYECLIANTGCEPDQYLVGDNPKWMVSQKEALAHDMTKAYLFGGRCRLDSTHLVYECLVAHTGAVPDQNTAGDSAKWQVVGATNRFAMFDNKWGTRTTAQNSLTVSLAPGASIDSVEALNCVGTYVTIVCTLDGVVIYAKEISLQTDIGVYDLYTYFTAPIVTESDVIETDFLPYYRQVLTVTITGPGQVGIGNYAAGRHLDIGKLKLGSESGITSYSQWRTDKYGNLEIDPLPYAKNFNGVFELEASFADQLESILASLRDIPVVWIGLDNSDPSLIVWGFMNDWKISRPSNGKCLCTFSIRGIV